MSIEVHSTRGDRMLRPTLVQKASIPSRSESLDLMTWPPHAETIRPPVG